MKKVMMYLMSFLFIGSMLIGCGGDPCCSGDDSLTTTATATTEAKTNQPPVAEMSLKIATPEEVEEARRNGTLVVIGESDTKNRDFHEEYEIVFYCTCTQTEYNGGKLIVDAKAGSATVSVDLLLTDEAKEVQEKYPNQTRYYRVINSGSIFLDNYHTLDAIVDDFNVWVKNIVNGNE